ncbi:MAG: TIGR04211 family SH3 domain-containing protein [Desulfobacula sp.]|nr:TIGR04211 family SH3 domain-containing protein [Desulfobacula sp.]
MKKIFTSLGILCMLFYSFPTYSQAQTGYVSDMLILTVRQGPGASFPVLQTLKSNTAVTILEEDKGYYKIELSTDETGWVDKQFIKFETPKTIRIEELTRQKDELETRLKTIFESNDQLNAQVTAQGSEQDKKSATLEAGHKEAVHKIKLLEDRLKETQNKYTTLKKQSNNIHEIVKKNKILEEKNKQLSTKIEQLENETIRLFRTGMIKWFLAGVGVLLLGWLIGQSISSNKKRSSFLMG